MIEKPYDSEKEQKPNWKLEEFYFGLGEWSIYRRDGERIQYRAEKAMPLSLKEGTHQYDSSVDGLADFLSEFEDCQLTVADSYELQAGGRQAPQLWAIGWKDLAEEQRHVYEREKAHAWKN